MKSYISRKFPLETRTTDQIFDCRSLGVIIRIWVVSTVTLSSRVLLGQLLLRSYPRGNSCPQTLGRGLSSNIWSTDFGLCQSFCDRVLDRIGSVGDAEMSQHHSARPDLTDGIRNSFPCNIGGGTVDRLKHRWVFLFRIQIRRRSDANRSDYGRAQVGKNITEKIGADNNVKPVRVSHKVSREDIDVELIGS